MTDMEYTIICIRRSAKRIVSLTNQPEVGLGSYYMMLGECMADMEKYKKVRAVPLSLANRELQEVIDSEDL